MRKSNIPVQKSTERKLRNNLACKRTRQIANHRSMYGNPLDVGRSEQTAEINMDAREKLIVCTDDVVHSRLP